MRRIRYPGIKRAVDACMRGHPPRPIVQIDPLERLAHLERTADEPVRGGVTHAIQMHVPFRIDDAGA